MGDTGNTASADTSIFTDKNHVPTSRDLKALGKTISLWEEIIKFVHTQYTDAKDEWSYPGAKFGWSFRIKDQKRVIIYLLPRDKFFKAAFVFCQKTYLDIMAADVNDDIKQMLSEARVYGEGRGIRIDVINKKILKDIKMLIDIKLRN